MLRSASTTAGPFSREAEDACDCVENLDRNRRDTLRTDRAFFGSVYVVTLLWALFWSGVLGSAIAFVSAVAFGV